MRGSDIHDAIQWFYGSDSPEDKPRYVYLEDGTEIFVSDGTIEYPLPNVQPNGHEGA